MDEDEKVIEKKIKGKKIKASEDTEPDVVAHKKIKGRQDDEPDVEAHVLTRRIHK
jgi:hypothetical protein